MRNEIISRTKIAKIQQGILYLCSLSAKATNDTDAGTLQVL